MRRHTSIFASLLALALGAGPVAAQTKPHSSASMSFNAPQMHPHRSGFHRPNRRHHHHFPGHPGYRPGRPQ